MDFASLCNLKFAQFSPATLLMPYTVDGVKLEDCGVPILSSIPFIGALFSYQDDEYVKSELVIFIRPVVVHEASLDGDLKEYRKYLMDDFDATPVQSE